ncbi:MAG TPA: hypothetical protein ENO08_07210 [Candidatus Eisenbacteria bacterium]|uniref:Porin family protein n=1 Tax=Eiseniibacteriota bacterium TaxID=2212470 RepID=A0A7V2AVW4_UNCEI|nr:hypothetical protein [Candidatus Eisenbacteria bacterium]
MKAITLAMTLAVLALPAAAGSQTLATMTTGAVSSDGEGGLFVLAGTDVSRFGLHSRFALAADLDMGMQLAFDRLDERSFFGGGIDVKYRLPFAAADLPIDIALDAGVGILESDEIRRLFLEMGCIVSGVVQSSDRRILEPYAGVYVMTARRDWKDDCGLDDRMCWEGTRSDTDAVLRGGLRVHVTDDFRVLVEMNVNGKTMFGAGVNLVF